MAETFGDLDVHGKDNIKIDLNINKIIGCEMHLFGQDPVASSRQQGNNASSGFIKGEEFLARVGDNQTANKNSVQQDWLIVQFVVLFVDPVLKGPVGIQLLCFTLWELRCVEGGW